jgi:hypothetical protein
VQEGEQISEHLVRVTVRGRVRGRVRVRVGVGVGVLLRVRLTRSYPNPCRKVSRSPSTSRRILGVSSSHCGWLGLR